MEAIIAVVGFLGAGKTTLLKKMVSSFVDQKWSPYLILNDYENAHLDAQYFVNELASNCVKPLSGSCICCSGIQQLRDFVNRVPEREKGITLVEANGTSDSVALMEFLGVGVEKRFLPPVQVSVVDVKNWQKRGEHNELERHQIMMSSLIVLTHLERSDEVRKKEVVLQIRALNPKAKLLDIDKVEVDLLPELLPVENKTEAFQHKKAHWSSASVDLPVLKDENSIRIICNAIPKTILRVKGCVQLEGESTYTYFERIPDGEIKIRPFNGVPVTGTKLLSIGSGSSPEVLQNAVKKGVL